MFILLQVLKWLGFILLGILSLAILYIFVLAVAAILVDPNKTYEKNNRFYRFLINSGAFFSYVGAGARLHVSGMEKVPKGTRFLLVGNHRSNFDPIYSWLVFKKYDIAFLSKEANFHIPAYGRLIKKCCFMAIDRENPRNATQTLHKAAELMRADEVSIGVYPEGTRGDGKELLPFHNGVFHIAKNANAPIVVLAVDGTEKISKNFPFHKTDVYLTVVDVLSADYVKANRTSVIGERVRESLNENLYNKREGVA